MNILKPAARVGPVVGAGAGEVGVDAFVGVWAVVDGPVGGTEVVVPIVVILTWITSMNIFNQ